jgi:hypothetical protein
MASINSASLNDISCVKGLVGFVNMKYPIERNSVLLLKPNFDCCIKEITQFVLIVRSIIQPTSSQSVPLTVCGPSLSQLEMIIWKDLENLHEKQKLFYTTTLYFSEDTIYNTSKFYISGLVVRVPDYTFGSLGSIPGATRFSET